MHNPLHTMDGFFYGELLLLGGFFHLLPRLTRPDIFFAVTVPPEYRRSDEARKILGRFQIRVWVHTLIAMALLTAGLLFGKVVLVLGATYWQIIGVFLAFQSARRKVSSHAVQASTGREAQLIPRRSGIPGAGLLHVGPFVLLAASALYLRAHWDAIPARFAVHWGLDGRPNGWANRTFTGVYGGLLLGAAICATLVLLWYGMLHWTRQIRAGGRDALNEWRFRRIQLIILLSCEYLFALLIGWVSAFPLRTNPEVLPGSFSYFGLGVLVYVAGIILALAWTGQGGTRLAGAGTELATPISGVPVGDRTPDRCWKAGLFYFNRDDPAIMVEHRFGIGYTLNFGHPVAWIVIAVLLLLPLSAALLIKLLQ